MTGHPIPGIGGQGQGKGFKTSPPGADPTCRSGLCDHIKIKVNFEDVTREVRNAEVRKSLIAAQMWCANLGVKPVAISIALVHNHPGQRYSKNHNLLGSELGFPRMAIIHLLSNEEAYAVFSQVVDKTRQGYACYTT
jgi:hypothetical protein